MMLDLSRGSWPRTAEEPAVPSTMFDAADHAVGDQFDAWRDCISVVFDVEPLAADTRGGFDAWARAFHLGNVVLARTRFGSQRFVHMPRAFRSNRVDHFLVQSYCRGGYVGEVGHAELEIQSGSVSVLDLHQRVATRATAAECLTLVVPRDLMHGVLPGESLHGAVLSEVYAGLFTNYLVSLERWLPTVRASLMPDVVSATCDLFAACARPSHERWERARATLERVESQTIMPPLLRRGSTQSGDKRLAPPGGIAEWVRGLTSARPV